MVFELAATVFALSEAAANYFHPLVGGGHYSRTATIRERLQFLELSTQHLYLYELATTLSRMRAEALRVSNKSFARLLFESGHYFVKVPY